jgi:hypothetical protein
MLLKVVCGMKKIDRCMSFEDSIQEKVDLFVIIAASNIFL